MDLKTSAFLADGKAGEAVFISGVRDAYSALSPEESFACDLHWEKMDGRMRTFRLRMPRFHSYPEEGAEFVREYFFALVFNILSVRGGLAAKMTNPDGAPEAAGLVEEFTRRFQARLARNRREGYGRALNVNDRMLRVLAPSSGVDRGFSLVLDNAPAAAPAAVSTPPSREAGEMFRRASRGLEGRTLLGIDIGGTDIKLALAVDGRLAALKEFDWNPGLFAGAEELIQPILTLTELMGLAAWAEGRKDVSGPIRAGLAKAMARGAELGVMRETVALARNADNEAGTLFDAIGVSFPDVVVADRIVGGETPKTRGMREALGAEYDGEFAKLTELSARLAVFVRKGGRVGIVNDGPMAAFTAGAEMAAVNPERVGQGVFAYSLGTDLGAGWVDERGRVPDIPLEAYNLIIDLGSRPERLYRPDDVRSVNSFNNGLPGCPQKYASQSGVFRLAAKYFAESRPALLEKIREAGFLRDRGAEGEEGLFVPASPRDMRKAFLEYLMDLAEREKDPVVERIFEDVGAAMAAVDMEIDWILAPATSRRFLFGRLVKREACFRLIAKGAAEAGSSVELVAADGDLAETPLMRDLGRAPGFTVAQFAQAVGAVHYANFRLLEESV